MYLSLLKRNRNFRLLYIGQTISQLGDWFNTVAVYSLLLLVFVVRPSGLLGERV